MAESIILQDPATIHCQLTPDFRSVDANPGVV